MRVVPNAGNDRVFDVVQRCASNVAQLDFASPQLSIFALGELVTAMSGMRAVRTIIPAHSQPAELLGDAADRIRRNRFGGCIIADSVGLGKTFEALAVIKYHELRNDRVLVLCPKRLRDNWTLYATNDRRNILAADRFNYDVLNHTDLSRDGGTSGDIDLGHVNWGNYDLVVIDESHNFRNKKSPRQGGLTRYDRLMKQIVKEGVRTRVLMLSATPVNNRLADLRNQIAFATGRSEADAVAHAVSAWRDVGFPITNVKEASPWGDGTRRERIRHFQRGLAEWAKERHGTWARAAKALGCDERTLREDAGE